MQPCCLQHPPGQVEAPIPELHACRAAAGILEQRQLGAAGPVGEPASDGKPLELMGSPKLRHQRAHPSQLSDQLGCMQGLSAMLPHLAAFGSDQE